MGENRGDRGNGENIHRRNGKTETNGDFFFTQSTARFSGIHVLLRCSVAPFLL
jgi:hypothetical protein